MKRFINQTTSSRISDAIVEAEKLLDPNSRLASDILWKDDWKYNSGTPKNIYTLLFEVEWKPISIYTYRPKNPFSKAIGYFDGKAIHINIRKLPQISGEGLVGLCLHEYAHACGFTHGSNWKTKEKCEKSVPYFLSENISRWL